jgi:hypothetical protein
MHFILCCSSLGLNIIILILLQAYEKSIEGSVFVLQPLILQLMVREISFGFAACGAEISISPQHDIQKHDQHRKKHKETKEAPEKKDTTIFGKSLEVVMEAQNQAKPHLRIPEFLENAFHQILLRGKEAQKMNFQSCRSQFHLKDVVLSGFSWTTNRI